MEKRATGMRNSVTRVILICCEGKTEKQYFEIIADIFRIHEVRTIEILGGKGQHIPLIDQTALERKALADRIGNYTGRNHCLGSL